MGCCGRPWGLRGTADWEADTVSHCAVPEVTILEPLQDLQLSEGQDAHFRCQLSRASGQEARWALGGVPLQANEMNDITVEDGTLHRLTLHKVGFLGPVPSHGAPRGVGEGRSQHRVGGLWRWWEQGCQAENPSLLQVTLEDAGTISFQVGSCSSEAQLKVTGGQPPPLSSPLPVGVCISLLRELFGGGMTRNPSFPEVNLPWGNPFSTPSWLKPQTRSPTRWTSACQLETFLCFGDPTMG